MKRTKRVLDEMNSRKIENLLDDYIYRKSFNNQKKRTNIEMDKHGVDVVVDDMFIDEKVAVNYMNRDLRTFAFELSSANNPNNSGWFSKDNDYMKTSHYLIGYLQGEDNELLKEEDIHQMELLLISKKKMWDYLKSHGGINMKMLDSIRKEKLSPMRESRRGSQDFYTGIPQTKIVYSKQLFEKPINILFDKELLIKIADRHIFFDGISKEVWEK